MPSPWSLFTPRRRLRRFALLDAAGICRALREAHEPPAGKGWVEVDELCCQWLGRPLPAEQLRLSLEPGSRPRPALA